MLRALPRHVWSASVAVLILTVTSAVGLIGVFAERERSDAEFAEAQLIYAKKSRLVSQRSGIESRAAALSVQPLLKETGFPAKTTALGAAAVQSEIKEDRSEIQADPEKSPKWCFLGRRRQNACLGGDQRGGNERSTLGLSGRRGGIDSAFVRRVHFYSIRTAIRGRPNLEAGARFANPGDALWVRGSSTGTIGWLGI